MVKKIFLLLLAGIVSSLVLTSCEKYSETDGNKIIQNEIVKENNITYVDGVMFNKTWDEANSTYGSYKKIDGYWDGNVYIDIVEDKASPATRIIYVTDKEVYNTVFTSDFDIDFNSEMIVIFRYTSCYNRKKTIDKVYIDEKNTLNIEFWINDNPGRGDASLPKTVSLILKMKNLWNNKVKIKYMGVK